MLEIKYPYLPEGWQFNFVPENDPLMLEAKIARTECAGDPIFPVGAVLVKDGKVLVRAGNGFNRGPSVHVCPRIVLDCPSGVGYKLCSLHDPEGHAESQLIKTASVAGIDTKDAHVYLYGHWWCCQPCWDNMINAGISKVFLPEKADELFSRDRVYSETFKSSVKKVTVIASNSLREIIESVCAEMGIEIVKDGADVVIVDGKEKGEDVVSESKAPVVLLIQGIEKDYERSEGVPTIYRVQYLSEDDAKKMLKNILKQL